MEASCARMGTQVARRSTGGFHAAHTDHIEANKAVRFIVEVIDSLLILNG